MECTVQCLTHSRCTVAGSSKGQCYFGESVQGAPAGLGRDLASVTITLHWKGVFPPITCCLAYSSSRGAQGLACGRCIS